MTQVGEAVGIALMETLKDECAFRPPSGIEEPSGEEEENAGYDDLESAKRIQENNGGTLGDNLGKGSPDGWGGQGTINNVYQPPERSPDSRSDSKTTMNTPNQLYVTVDGQQLPFMNAAHHCIPGNASLKPSTLFKQYMVKDGKARTTKGRTYTMKCHIGYNVNGNHNGIWLPANYAIRKNGEPGYPHNPRNKTWSSLIDTERDWCWKYMCACVKQVGGQFHDTHGDYNTAVRDAFRAMAVALAAHQDTDCTYCKPKDGEKIYPPFRLKQRLYVFSRYLRMQLRVSPRTWKMPWVTSDRFKEELMLRGMVLP